MVEQWPPSRYSPTLSPVFESDADWLLRLVELVWRLPNGDRVVLDPWQRELLRAMLEVYPAGHERAGQLRYRQILVSMGRQNGKSLIGGILALYGLVRESGALIIGLASNADQAGIIYRRLLQVINANPALAKRFKRLTDTRGIQSKDGSNYLVKPSKSAAVQGLDLSLGLVDELHLVLPALWSDMVNGARARQNAVVIGITTAGDDESELLLRLYDDIGKGRAGERFGYFIWESPEARIPADKSKFLELLAHANPAIAAGRVDVETVYTDLQNMPEPDILRYAFNRFVASSNELMPLSVWMRGAKAELPDPVEPIFTVDRLPDWSAATITASWKHPDQDGVVCTEIVSVVMKPTVEKLAAECDRLARYAPTNYVMDSYTLKPVAAELKRRGLPVQTMSLADVTSASALFYAMVAAGHVHHLGEALLSRQIPAASRKNVGDNWRIVRQSGASIDALMSTVLGVYAAATLQTDNMQLFV